MDVSYCCSELTFCPEPPDPHRINEYKAPNGSSYSSVSLLDLCQEDTKNGTANLTQSGSTLTYYFAVSESIGDP